MEKNFLDSLNDWGKILTDTYEKGVDAYTFKFNDEYPMYEYKITNWDTLSIGYQYVKGYQYVSTTKNVIGTLDSITLINTSNKKDFKIRRHYGGNEGDYIYRITTKLKNILINGKPILEWLFADPLIDKKIMINLVTGLTGYMKHYREYEDLTVNILINHMANNKIIISSNAIFSSDYEIENNLDLIEFERRFKK